MRSRANTTIAAEEVMAKAGKTFHQAARLLPATVRTQVILLYAFCRTVDDIADDPRSPVQERRAALERLLGSLESADMEALSRSGWSLGDHPRRLGCAAVLVRAALGDLQQVQPRTENEVLAYAFGVAGSVGLLMADVLRADPKGLGAAVALGCAMQLTNICRDVAEDARQGRVYLPASLVEKAAVLQALAGHDAQAAHAVREATYRLLACAEALYEAAYDGMWTLPGRVRWSILVAALCYREIGVQVASNVDRSWQTRTVVRRARKLQLVLKASLRLLLPRFWWPRSRANWPVRLGSGVTVQLRHLGVTV